LYRYTDKAAFRLRAGLNAVCNETSDLIEAAVETYGNITIQRSEENLQKCPMMRRLFHNPKLDTDWTLWFDDDSHFASASWIMDLALSMERLSAAELFGSLRLVDVSDGLEKFITSAHWYRGIPRRKDPVDGRPTIIFPVGSFFAVRTEKIVQTDWPDQRLGHYQTDFTMGEAMRQHGVQIADFCSGLVLDDAERRAPEELPYELRLDHEPP